jgi:Domain of unknown function (DUF4252)
MTNLKTRTGPWYLALVVMCATLPGYAQPGKLQLDNLDKLSSKASVVNDVSLDGALLGLATKAVQSSNDPDAAELKEAVKGLKGIYIKNFEFDKLHQYSPEDVDAIRAQLAHGWTRIVQSHDKRQDELDEIYMLKDGDKVGGIAILVAEPKELTVVNIVGTIDLEKLGALAGKFGIPEEIKDKTEKPKTKTPTPAKPDKKEDSHDDDQDVDQQ